MPEQLIGPAFFRFLTNLRAHNDRDWFQAHKQEYETRVRDPFVRVLEALAPRLQKLDPRSSSICVRSAAR